MKRDRPIDHLGYQWQPTAAFPLRFPIEENKQKDCAEKYLATKVEMPCTTDVIKREHSVN